jgi:hypothetical protein
MNEPETRRLLGYISAGYDNRALSEATAQVWAEELAGVPFEVAKQSVRNHFHKPKPRDYLSLDVLMEQIKVDTRQTRQAIEEDVRSAKARGLLEQSWPPREPLPQSVAADLAEARALFGREMAQYEAIEVGTGAPIDVGQIGKAIPHA